MTMLVNLSAKDLQKEVKYINPVKTNILNNKLPSIEEMTFLAQSLQKEVNSKRRKKQFLKIAKVTIATSLSILILVDPTFTLAATVLPITSTPDMITPPDIIKLCKYLLGIAVTIGFSIAIVMSVIASSLGYFRKSTESNKWVIEIIKSFVMMLLAPMIIITIAMVAFMLFGGSDWFIKVF